LGWAYWSALATRRGRHFAEVVEQAHRDYRIRALYLRERYLSKGSKCDDFLVL